MDGEFIFETIDQLMDHQVLGFAEHFLHDKDYQDYVDSFYGTFRTIHKVPTGEMLPDDLLPLFHASVYQLLLKYALPDLDCKVSPTADDKFRVVYKSSAE